MHCGVRAFALSASIGVVDEDRLPNLLQIFHQDMVDHPVSKIRREYLSQLRLLEHKADRTGWSVGLTLKLLLEPYEVFLQVILKPEGALRYGSASRFLLRTYGLHNSEHPE